MVSIFEIYQREVVILAKTFVRNILIRPRPIGSKAWDCIRKLAVLALTLQSR